MIHAAAPMEFLLFRDKLYLPQFHRVSILWVIAAINLFLKHSVCNSSFIRGIQSNLGSLASRLG